MNYFPNVLHIKFIYTNSNCTAILTYKRVHSFKIFPVIKKILPQQRKHHKLLSILFNFQHIFTIEKTFLSGRRALSDKMWYSTANYCQLTFLCFNHHTIYGYQSINLTQHLHVYVNAVIMMSWSDKLIRVCPQGLAQKWASFWHIYVGLFRRLQKNYYGT